MSSQRRVLLAALCTGLVAIGLSVTVVALRGSASAGAHRPGPSTSATPTGSEQALPAVSAPSGEPVPSAGSASPSHSRSPGQSRSASASPSSKAAGAPLQPSTRTVGAFGTQILTGSSAVALTFDDGPDPNLTPQILDLLKQQGVKATFCVIGSRARDYPDLVRRIAAEGHTLCNHSWQHLMELSARDPSYQHWDLSGTNDAIRAAVPNATIKYFRAPGGNFTKQLDDLAAGYGMTSLNWDVDPRDWDAAQFGKGASMVNHIVTVVQQTTRPGSIVLSHDRAHPDTLTAYQTLLPWLKEHHQLIALP